MIYTVTFNPSLDYIVTVKNWEQGATNRTDTEQMLPGGKGINVSVVLQNLGVQSTALGFVAGFTGEEIVRQVEALGVKTDFIKLAQGVSRINVKLKTDGTELNGGGPGITKEEQQVLSDKLACLESGDILVLAGSIPKTMPDDAYQQIMKALQGKGILMVVDATKDLLCKVLEYRPFLVKPNHHELGELFGVDVKHRQQVIPYARKLQELGAQNVLVSLADEGAVLLTADGQVLEAEAPEGTLVNGVGAGDSMVAGFLAGWLEQRDASHAFRMGVAAGSASAFSEKLATGAEVASLYERVKVYRKS